ncbi:MAG: hypothetical protein U9R34_01425 [Nanoarchaeota archaeon]|nr:hypothetical protein [Nanoarchaeota archaeon]
MNQEIKDLAVKLSEITGCDIPPKTFSKYYASSSYGQSYSKVAPDCDKLYGSTHISNNFGFVSRFKLILPTGKIIESYEGSYQSKDQTHEQTIINTLEILVKMYENPELGVKLDENYRYCSNIS